MTVFSYIVTATGAATLAALFVPDRPAPQTLNSRRAASGELGAPAPPHREK